MKVLGLVVEYNPFHNGHAYHIEQSRKLCKADCVICVMSGNFIQRGEPAIVNKWARAKMALLSGADLVIELPAVYATGSAEYFSHGAVKILDSLGLVDYLCFGSEHGDIKALDEIANVLLEEPDSYKYKIKELLGTGISYASAREAALSNYFKSMGLPGDINEIIGSSNNILGIEYLKSLKKLNSKITPVTIKRIANTYDATDLTGSISSATSIRNQINSYDSRCCFGKELMAALPENSVGILKEEFASGRGPVVFSNFETLLLYQLRKASTTSISYLQYVSEGLENRIKAAAEAAGTYIDLVDRICTKRYTRTRIQRILLNSLFGMTSEEFNTFNSFGGPQYIRVLGFNKTGQKALSDMKTRATLPVIIKAGDSRNSCNPLFKRMFELEALATDLYVLGYKNPEFRQSGQEFTQNVIIVR